MSYIIDEEPGMYRPILDLDNLYDFFEKQDFFFSKEILTRYYLSLKTKPFVILTGISGTGKTKIAQIFADYICRDDKKSEQRNRIAFVSVRPDWMDNKGILGFYNVLDENYYTTRCLDVLLAAEKNPQKAHFIILDEMNLARVEQYFSDFLSVMESRTSNSPLGESIPLHAMKDITTSTGKIVPGNIHIPSNVYITGTVNVDESTYMFSPKVLDRANVLEFNDVNLDAYGRRSVPVENKPFILQNEKIKNNLMDGAMTGFCSRNDYSQFCQLDEKTDLLNELQAVLRKFNMHFGYRVANEISRFTMLCHDQLQDFDFNAVMDIQIIQKILPKFHGTRAKLEPPLVALLALCRDDTSLPESDMHSSFDENFSNSRLPRSAKKISRMLQQLDVQGYAGFIE